MTALLQSAHRAVERIREQKGTVGGGSTDRNTKRTSAIATCSKDEVLFYIKKNRRTELFLMIFLLSGEKGKKKSRHWGGPKKLPSAGGMQREENVGTRT